MRPIHGEAFNFSNEDPQTVLEMVELIREATGRLDLDPVVLGKAPNEIPDQFLSSAKARSVLGWQPRYELRDGLERTYRWYQQHVRELDLQLRTEGAAD